MPWDEHNKIEWGGDPTQKKPKGACCFSLHDMLNEKYMISFHGVCNEHCRMWLCSIYK